jgi:hypothetical protein
MVGRPALTSADILLCSVTEWNFIVEPGSLKHVPRVSVFFPFSHVKSHEATFHAAGASFRIEGKEGNPNLIGNSNERTSRDRVQFICDTGGTRPDR